MCFHLGRLHISVFTGPSGRASTRPISSDMYYRRR